MSSNTLYRLAPVFHQIYYLLVGAVRYRRYSIVLATFNVRSLTSTGQCKCLSRVWKNSTTDVRCVQDTPIRGCVVGLTFPSEALFWDRVWYGVN